MINKLKDWGVAACTSVMQFEVALVALKSLFLRRRMIEPKGQRMSWLCTGQQKYFWGARRMKPLQKGEHLIWIIYLIADDLTEIAIWSSHSTEDFITQHFKHFINKHIKEEHTSWNSYVHTSWASVSLAPSPTSQKALHHPFSNFIHSITNEALLNLRFDALKRVLSTSSIYFCKSLGYSSLITWIAFWGFGVAFSKTTWQACQMSLGQRNDIPSWGEEKCGESRDVVKAPSDCYQMDELTYRL